MVDFNAGSALSIPISDVKRMLVMEKREEVLKALRRLYMDGSSGDHDQLMDVRSQMIILFLELQRFLQEHYSEEYPIIQNKDLLLKI